MTAAVSAGGPSLPGTSVGTVILCLSAASALLLAFFGRTRLPWGFVSFLLALCGAGIALGLAAVHDSSTWPQLISAIVVLGVLTPLHVRVVLGPLGRRG